MVKRQSWRSTHPPVFCGAVVASVIHWQKSAGYAKSLISFHFLSKVLGRSSWKTWIVQNGSSQAKVSDASLFFCSRRLAACVKLQYSFKKTASSTTGTKLSRPTVCAHMGSGYMGNNVDKTQNNHTD